MVVEVAGTQTRLTGTAEIQYDEWKQLLRELYISETGLELEQQVEIFVEPVVEPPVVLPVESPESAPQATSESPSSEESEIVESGAGA